MWVQTEELQFNIARAAERMCKAVAMEPEQQLANDESKGSRTMQLYTRNGDHPTYDDAMWKHGHTEPVVPDGSRAMFDDVAGTMEEGLEGPPWRHT